VEGQIDVEHGWLNPVVGPRLYLVAVPFTHGPPSQLTPSMLLGTRLGATALSVGSLVSLSLLETIAGLL